MAAPESKPASGGLLDATGLTVAVIASRWNAVISEALRDGAARAVTDAGGRVEHVSAPGAFELPFAARTVARSGQADAIVVVGCVIRGETTHYELVSEGCAHGVMQVQLDTGVPIGLGIATVETHEQAVARSEGAGGHNVGHDAALAAIEMALLSRDRAPAVG